MMIPSSLWVVTESGNSKTTQRSCNLSPKNSTKQLHLKKL